MYYPMTRQNSCIHVVTLTRWMFTRSHVALQTLKAAQMESRLLQQEGRAQQSEARGAQMESRIAELPRMLEGAPPPPPHKEYHVLQYQWVLCRWR